VLTRVLFESFISYRAVNTLHQTCTMEVPSSNLDYPDAHLSALSLFLQVQKGTVIPIRPIQLPVTFFRINYQHQFSWDLRSSWILHSVDLWLVTDVSGRPSGRIVEGPAFEGEFILLSSFTLFHFCKLCILILVFMYSFCYLYSILGIVLYRSTYCLCVNVYYTSATGCQPNFS
jgi:hypothetical protein